MITERLDVRANGDGAQVYFPTDLATDTAFPLETDQEIIAQPTACGRALALVPVPAVESYPLRVESIPTELLNQAEQQVYLEEAPEP